MLRPNFMRPEEQSAMAGKAGGTAPLAAAGRTKPKPTSSSLLRIGNRGILHSLPQGRREGGLQCCRTHGLPRDQTARVDLLALDAAAWLRGGCVAPALEATCACGAYPRISVKAATRPTRPLRGRRYAFISVDEQPMARACWPSNVLRTAHFRRGHRRLDRMRPMREGYNPEGSLPRLGQREEKRP